MALINDSIGQDNYNHTLHLIKNSLPQDEKLIVIDQNAYIYHNELKSLKNVSYHLLPIVIKLTEKFLKYL